MPADELTVSSCIPTRLGFRLALSCGEKFVTGMPIVVGIPDAGFFNRAEKKK